MTETLKLQVEKDQWSELDRVLNRYQLQGWTLYDLRQDKDRNFDVKFQREVSQPEPIEAPDGISAPIRYVLRSAN